MRKSGILLHPVSLPGAGGIGEIGLQARRFADWLRITGQTVWQVLPLGPAGGGHSPYMSYSAFAGNPLLISPGDLQRRGWLGSTEVHAAPADDDERVDYSAAAAWKQPLLRRAFAAFSDDPGVHEEEFQRFRQQQAFWLENYALFMALKQEYRNQAWYQWPADLAAADQETLGAARRDLAREIRFHEFVQFLFFHQWQDLRGYCHHRGIELIGDLPLYVALDSADVWAHRHLFQLDAHGRPNAVAGVPPDYFSASGQRWGNPLFRWQAMAEDHYRWWVERFRVNFQLVDRLRLDHFRGYQAYWEVPADDLHTTRNGTWVQGPGAPFFHAVEAALDRSGVSHGFIAEDLGVITPDVDELREQLGYPGMRILQMAFGTDPKASEYLPHNHVRNCVVYTATHDHNTSRGWFTVEPGTQTAQTAEEVARERAHALTYLGTDGSSIHWDMIRMALGSVADTAIIPLQDVLGLDSSARMNLPGTAEGNWAWRFRWQALEGEPSDTLATLTRVFERAQPSGL